MDDQQNTTAGYGFGIGVYLVWGLVPLYFKLLDHVGAVETVAHRITWSVGLLLALLLVLGKVRNLGIIFRNRRTLLALTASATLIGGNWLVYIWAVTHEHILAASLGYFLNPLLNVVLGTVLLKEKLRPATLAAIILAAIGVAILAVSALDTLWISVSLAVSFALYGYIRKVTDAGAIEGLAVETLLLSPVCVAYLIWLGMAGGLMFGASLETDMLLIFSAAVTSVPLMLFAAAAKRLTLTTLGFIQYVAPSMVFLIGAFVFNEPLNSGQLLCFALIWAGLALFTFDSIRTAHANRTRARLAA
ncbi:EamA family transporter RarD [Parasphingopyxis lamellibrachiae]|uniref:Chloramphenicol-sensitive protein RarD n=1 Tax=Parasphingopyxis lamellibrachiae TaxID=680125 RepID=A0A3D9FG50_9SPHN|nr:EamA family transporter RarD [Parasphingopyxis lamellibrachiae]RED16794.1 chloramphenicol-sensitive protein RarD [Parasphingopyxis lamellibrachiae]